MKPAITKLFTASAFAFGLVMAAPASAQCPPYVTADPDIPAGGPWTVTTTAAPVSVNTPLGDGADCQLNISATVDACGTMTDVDLEITSIDPNDPVQECEAATISSNGTGQWLSDEEVQIDGVTVGTSVGTCGPGDIVVGWANDPDSNFDLTGAELPIVALPPFTCVFVGDSDPTSPLLTVTP